MSQSSNEEKRSAASKVPALYHVDFRWSVPDSDHKVSPH